MLPTAPGAAPRHPSAGSRGPCEGGADMAQWKHVLGRCGPAHALALSRCGRASSGQTWPGLSGKCQDQVWSPEMRALGDRQVALTCWEPGAAQVTEPTPPHRAPSTLPGPTSSAPAEATSTLAGAVPPKAASTAVSKASPAPAPTGVLAVAVPPGPLVAVTTTAAAGPAVATVAVLGTVTKDR